MILLFELVVVLLLWGKSAEAAAWPADDNGNFQLRVYHVNDIHVRLDEINAEGNDCDPAEEMCYGGSSRIKRYLHEHRKGDRPSMLLSAGDESTGSLFYKHYRHEKVAETMNQMNFTAMALGNHEFDDGIEELGTFVSKLDFPVLSTNTDIPPGGSGKTLRTKLEKWHVFEEYDIAIIGVTTPTTAFESKSGREASFRPSVESVQEAIDEIRSTTSINRIMLLSHVGYDVDREIARNTNGLYYIVGGHTDTLLGDMAGAEGPYPTVEFNKDGEKVFIVQDFHWGIYLGINDVTFAPDGKVLNVEGKPILMKDQQQRDSMLQAQVDRWRHGFTEWAQKVIGDNHVENDYKNPDCKGFPCFAGAFAADALYDAYHKNNTDDELAFSIVNGGGCRTSIPVGQVTNSDLHNNSPFENILIRLDLSGQIIWDTFNRVLSGLEEDKRHHGTFFQVSQNVAIQWNYSTPDHNRRLVSVAVNGKPLDMETNYSIITTDFLGLGGDKYWKISRDKWAKEYGLVEDALRDYVAGGGLHEYRDRNRTVELSKAYITTRAEETGVLRPQEDPNPWNPDVAMIAMGWSMQPTYLSLISCFFLSLILHVLH